MIFQKQKHFLGNVADWYHEMLEDDAGTYQKMSFTKLNASDGFKKDEKRLDIACGTGYFAREFIKSGQRFLLATYRRNSSPSPKKILPRK